MKTKRALERDDLTSWTLADILNEKYLAMRIPGPLPSSFKDEQEWATAFKPFILEEIRYALNDCMVNLDQCRSVRCKVDEVKIDGIAIAIRFPRSDIQPLLKEAEKDITKGVTLYMTYALLVRQAPANVTLRGLSNLQYALCHLDGSEKSEEAELSGDDNKNELEQCVFAHGRICFGNLREDVLPDNWECLFFGVSSLVADRALTALRYFQLPYFRSDFLEGRTAFDPTECTISRDNDYFLHQLNASQRIAVEGVLCAINKESSAIRIIKGPPGTGKTSTLVALLHALRSKNYRVHVTAQGNIAVAEVAARYYRDILRMRSEANIGEDCVPMSHLRAADILIVGRSSKYEGDLNMERLLFSHRLNRCALYPDKIRALKNMMCAPAHIIDASRDRKKSNIPFSEYFRDEIVQAIDMFDMCLDECYRTCIQHCHQCAINKLKYMRSAVAELTDDAINAWRDQEHDSCEHPVEVMRQTIYSCLEQLPTLSQNMHFINDANILFSTVATAGNRCIRSQEFDVVIIDEATQLVESHVAIVMKPSLRCLVLAGDDKQLPPTILSQHAVCAGYSRSLFERLIQRGYPFKLLDIQYRMHPSISEWPSFAFYDGLLKNGDNVMDKPYSKPWHDKIPPFSLFDVKGIEEQTAEGSWINEVEGKIVKQMLLMVNRIVLEPCVVGIISPYSGQIKELKELEVSKSSPGNCRVVVKSIDGFQGRECDIVILCTVRSNDRHAIGFLRDIRRLNVALTRSKYALIVICNTDTLSNNRTWRELISHAKNGDHLKDTKNHVVIRKVSKNHSVLIQHMQALIQSKSQLFEELPWQITFCADFRNTIAKIPETVLNKIFQCIILIGQGKWSGRSSIFQSCLRLARIQDLRLIWSVDIFQGSRRQYVKIWNIVHFDKLNVTMQRIDSSMKSWTEQYITLCRETNFDSSNKCYLPITYSSSIKIEWFSMTSKNQCPMSTASQAIHGAVNDSTLLMKFYPLTSGVASLLLQTESAAIDLPFVMSADEEELVKYKGSVFILGRSGTGKTTVMLHRMFLETIYLHKIYSCENDMTSSNETSPPYAQLMVTASNVLCDAIRRTYDNMCRSARLTNKDVQLPERDVSYEDVASFSPNANIQSPIIITFSKFLRLLDGTLNHSFFAIQNVASDVCGGVVSVRSIEVDYEFFLVNFYPHFNQQLKMDSSTLYTEIMTHIKGSVAALHTDRGCISEVDYLKLSGSRQSTVSSSQRKAIYEAYEKYEELKGRMPEVYDTAELVHYIYTSLTANSYNGRMMTSVYIDEVQDLSPAQIALFQFVCQNQRGFVFAGDTAQTIAHGVGFRFETVKDIFYHEFLHNSPSSVDKNEWVPKLKFLSRNFRTHIGIVNIACTIVDLIVRFFPHTIDKMEPETSSVAGPRPVYITSNTDVILDLFSDGTMHSCEFGAEQAILVRDDETKRIVKDICGDKALVLTALEAKGMEFADCLIYNFFESCPTKNDWRVILEVCPDVTEKFTKFDAQKHGALCVELKILYVLITRTRQRLMIYDSDKTTADPLLKLWRQRKLITYQPFDEDVRNMFAQASSADEWLAKGKDFF